MLEKDSTCSQAQVMVNYQHGKEHGLLSLNPPYHPTVTYVPVLHLVQDLSHHQHDSWPRLSAQSAGKKNAPCCSHGNYSNSHVMFLANVTICNNVCDTTTG